MKVVTAVEQYDPKEGEISVFLGGGITDCWDWQKAVIEDLKLLDNTDRLVVFNPRRENFPIDDPNAAQEQIEWEFANLNRADIFTMYFCNSNSVQPICMYELGRHLARWEQDLIESVVITVENGYSRAQDVQIQSKLVTSANVPVSSLLDPRQTATKHAHDIYLAYLSLI